MINKNKIGVLAGTFDPIHLGHISFIERTIRQNDLSKVYLLIEKTPKHKPVFADYTHRLKTTELAIVDHPDIQIYNCNAASYPISHCLPEIKKTNQQSKIYLLAGQDVAEHIKSWEGASDLLKGIELVIADRNDGITSGKIRNSLEQNQLPAGLDPKVLDYIRSKKLYYSEIMSGA